MTAAAFAGVALGVPVVAKTAVGIDLQHSYRCYGPMVLRRCRALLRDEQKAEDAMQDVFVRLLKRAGSLESGALSSLLYTMATQVCLNRMRSERRHPEDHDEELLLRIAHAGNAEQRTLSMLMLERLLGQEPVSSGLIAVLHLHDGLTLEEVAQETGLSVSGVRKRLRKLRGRLQSLARTEAA